MCSRVHNHSIYRITTRAKVTAGSHVEGEYFRKCINIFKAHLEKHNLTLSNVPDEELKKHYKHTRPLGNEWQYKPLL